MRFDVTRQRREIALLHPQIKQLLPLIRRERLQRGVTLQQAIECGAKIFSRGAGEIGEGKIGLGVAKLFEGATELGVQRGAVESMRA